MDRPENLKRRQDKRDPETRAFRHFAKVSKKGELLAIVERSVDAPEPTDGEGNRYIDVTALYPYDLATVQAVLKR